MTGSVEEEALPVILHLDEEYYFALLTIGLVILAVGLLREFLSNKAPASDVMLSTLVGIILGPSVSGVIDPYKWSGSMLHAEMGDIDGQFPYIYKVATELMRIVLAVQLVSFALSVPWDYIIKAWRAQSVLLSLIMVAMWLSSSLVVWVAFQIPHGGALSFGAWEALLIGACVSPTDPVLASGITTTVLAERNLPSRVRHTISIESAFNDGVGFPFVSLPLLFLTYKHHTPAQIFKEFFVITIIYQIILAGIIGAVLGFLIGKVLKWAEPKKLHDKQLLVALTIAIALVFVSSFRLLNLDELIGVIIGATAYAYVTQGRHRETREQLQETVDLLFSTLAFLLYGMMIPWGKWADLIGGKRGAVLAIGILFMRRLPWVMAAKPLLRPMIRTNLEAAFVGWFGPIGIGAIFYATFAVECTGNEVYWHVVSLIVFVSIVAFGFTDTFLTKLYGILEPAIRNHSAKKHDDRAHDEEELERIRAERERTRRVVRTMVKTGSKLNLRDSADMEVIANLSNILASTMTIPPPETEAFLANQGTPDRSPSHSPHGTPAITPSSSHQHHLNQLGDTQSIRGSSADVPRPSRHVHHDGIGYSMNMLTHPSAADLSAMDDPDFHLLPSLHTLIPAIPHEHTDHSEAMPGDGHHPHDHHITQVHHRNPLAESMRNLVMNRSMNELPRHHHNQHHGDEHRPANPYHHPHHLAHHHPTGTSGNLHTTRELMPSLRHLIPPIVPEYNNSDTDDGYRNETRTTPERLSRVDDDEPLPRSSSVSFSSSARGRASSGIEMQVMGPPALIPPSVTLPPITPPAQSPRTSAHRRAAMRESTTLHKSDSPVEDPKVRLHLDPQDTPSHHHDNDHNPDITTTPTHTAKPITNTTQDEDIHETAPEGHNLPSSPSLQFVSSVGSDVAADTPLIPSNEEESEGKDKTM
eukprot:TRINITY_DN4577_c0_g1_i3.p1 TRINITY_DN4577_c0_g1~~TRINITY_DN4577_c0_g1_i3.p1  ORF type:complete len:924 (+),score=245.49 TRINITY_DN4577_c0_g1_i3:65-2836(+)